MNLKFWYSKIHDNDMRSRVRQAGLGHVVCTALIDGEIREYTATSKVNAEAPAGVNVDLFHDYQAIGIGSKDSIKVSKMPLKRSSCV
jgi:hypothetical protein